MVLALLEVISLVKKRVDDDVVASSVDVRGWCSSSSSSNVTCFFVEEAEGDG